jgi:hypothetical protein
MMTLKEEGKVILFFFFFFIHMCIQGLGHFSPLGKVILVLTLEMTPFQSIESIFYS